MTLLAELRADIEEMLRQGSGRAVLWLDPEGQWERLLNRLGGEFELVKYDGSQLELRVAVERRPVGQKGRILYVPLPREGLTVLKEYEFLLPVWDEKLLIALRRWVWGSPARRRRRFCASCPASPPDGPTGPWRRGAI